MKDLEKHLNNNRINNDSYQCNELNYIKAIYYIKGYKAASILKKNKSFICKYCKSDELEIKSFLCLECGNIQDY